MVTRDVLKVLKLHSPTARAILRTFKTSLVPINHEMHSRSYDFLYIYAFIKVEPYAIDLFSLYVMLRSQENFHLCRLQIVRIYVLE